MANHARSKKIKAAVLSCFLSCACLLPPPVVAQSGGAGGETAELRAEVEKYKGNPRKKAELADGLYRLGKALAEARNFTEAEANLEAALALDIELGKNDAVVNDYVALALVQTYQKIMTKPRMYTQRLSTWPNPSQ